MLTNIKKKNTMSREGFMRQGGKKEGKRKEELQDEAKLRVMMLTGDHESSARRVASGVGINEFHCNLKPEDKLSHVKDISRDMGKFLD